MYAPLKGARISNGSPAPASEDDTENDSPSASSFTWEADQERAGRANPHDRQRYSPSWPYWRYSYSIIEEQRWHIWASMTVFWDSPMSPSTPNASVGLSTRSAMAAHRGSSALYTSVADGVALQAPTMLSWMRSISPTRSSWSRNRFSRMM